jgi:tripartite-type tricarboxylate transporter receptor subunit TctC
MLRETLEDNMKIILKNAITAALAGVMAVMVALPSYAVDFSGKTVEVAIRSTPGGGYDFHGRLMARHIGKYLPGNPEVIAVNRPGAGGVVGANWLYAQAPKDGTAIFVAARELALAERLGGEGIRYKSAEMPVLGSPVSDSRVLMSAKDSTVKTLADLKMLGREFIFSTSGIGAGSTQVQQLLKDAGYPVKIVTGYEGSGDQALAMLRGEVDGMSGTYPSQKDVIDKEGFNIFAKLGNHPDLKGVPDLRDAMEGQYRTLAKILATPLLAGRPFITAPGTPPEVVAVLREAFRKTIQDPDYVKELTQAGQKVGYTSPEEIEDLYKEILAAPVEIVALFAKKKKKK